MSWTAIVRSVGGECTFATTAIAASIPWRGRWNWFASSTTAPIPTAPVRRGPRPGTRNRHRVPKGAIGWDVLCWIGHRRCSRHWSIPQIQTELSDAYAIQLSADSLSRYVRHYPIMLAARQQDPAALRRQYQGVDSIILSIAGLQPEKGHETLYVVRELTQKRVWFAEPLLSATADEVRRLIAQAKEWAAALGKPVALWLSDRQDAFVTGIAAEFPDVPHRSGTADAARLRPGRRRGRRDPRPGGGRARNGGGSLRN